MGRFVHTIAGRCNIDGISVHAKRYNDLTNEALKQLQNGGANIVDIHFQVNKDPYPSSMCTVTYVIVYDADTPIDTGRFRYFY